MNRRSDEITSFLNRQDFSHRSGAYDYLKGGSMKSRYALLGGLAQGFGAKSVLDVGCGLGYLCRFLPSETSYVGIDVSRYAIEQCMKTFGQRGNTEFKECLTVEFRSDRVFDCVVWAGIGIGSVDQNSDPKDGWMLTIKHLMTFCSREGHLILECISDYEADLLSLLIPDQIENHSRLVCVGSEMYAERSCIVAKPH